MRRRELMVGLSALASATLAGCSGDSEGGEPTETESEPTGTEPTATGSATSQQMGDPDGEVIGNDGPMVITEYSSEVRYYESDIDNVESGDRYIVDGVLENTGDEMASAEIDVTFYNADDERVNGYIFREFGIEAGGTWEFSASHSGDPEAVDSYTLEPSTV